MVLPSAGGGGWGESRLPECNVRTLIEADRLSRCAPQHNLICDWSRLAGWLLQMGASSSNCHQEDNILLSNYKHPMRRHTGAGVRHQRSKQMLFYNPEHPQIEKLGISIILTAYNIISICIYSAIYTGTVNIYNTSNLSKHKKRK